MFKTLQTLFSKKNTNLIIGLFTVLIALWLIMFVIPGLFVNLFDTLLGNIILFLLIFLAYNHNKHLALGLAFIFIVLWRFSHMSNPSLF